MFWRRAAGRKGRCSHDRKSGIATGLEFVGFLGVGEAGEGGRWAAARDLHAKGWLGFGAGLAQDDESGQGLAVNLGDQEAVSAFVFLPNLANLNLPNGHRLNVEGFTVRVNTLRRR
jgi:hypothetical protein